MTDLAFKLPSGGQPVMVLSSTFFTNNTFSDPHIPVMLFACSFIGKPLSKKQCIHVLFHAKLHQGYAKQCRSV